MRLPPNNKYIQTNRSDILGSLEGSFNIDITRVLGKLRVTRMIKTMSGFNNFPVGFKYYSDGTIYTIAGLYIYHTADGHPRSVFSQDAGTGTPNTCDSLYSDIEIFNNLVYGTTYEGGGDRLVYGSSASWSYVTGLGTQTGPHMLAVYGARLYITISTTNKIYSIDTGNTLSVPNGPPNTTPYTLQLEVNYRPTFIKAGSNRMWIGVMAFSGKGYIYEWDGAATQYTRAYKLDAQGAWAGVIKDDLPWVMDSNGRLLQYSNGTFIERGRLPINDKYLVNATNIFTNNRPVHPNGMSIVNGKINVLVNSMIDDGNSSTAEFCPSGIWEFDEETNSFYHKSSLSYLPVGTNTISDYGQQKISIAGGLSEMKNSDPNAAATGNLLAGAQIFTDATTTANASFTNDTFDTVSGTTGQYSTDGFGYFITNKITSPNIMQTWQRLILFYKKLLSSSGRIIVKYRTNAVKSTEASITWIDTTSFTTSISLSSYAVGDEVEITQGSGGGRNANITALSVNGGTTTVTIDESCGGTPAGTAKARFQKWIKLKTVVNDQASQIKIFTLGINSSWIQFKICMNFKGLDEFECAELVNEVHQYVA